MAAYHQAGFTIDPLDPIGDEPTSAVGVDEYGFGDELIGVADEYTANVAGPLRLGLEDVGMTLTATIEGAQDEARIDWGDGESSTIQDSTAEHVYRMVGVYTVAAHATVDGVSYAVAKTRLMGSS